MCLDNVFCFLQQNETSRYHLVVIYSNSNNYYGYNTFAVFKFLLVMIINKYVNYTTVREGSGTKGGNYPVQPPSNTWINKPSIPEPSSFNKIRSVFSCCSGS